MQFHICWYAKRTGVRALIANHIGEFIAKPYKDKYLIICHTESYGLKLFNINTKKIEKDFNKEYSGPLTEDGSGRTRSGLKFQSGTPSGTFQ